MRAERLTSDNEYTSNRTLQQSIGEAALNVSGFEHMPEPLLRAYETLTGENLSYEDFVSEVERLGCLDLGDWFHLDPNDRDRGNSVKTLRQLFEGGMQWPNVLRAWPYYQHMYETHAHVDELGSAETNNALLIGSLGSLSARTYEVFSREVYGANRACIIDVAGGADKQRHGTFIYGDARHIPFADNTIRVINSNYVLGWLGDDQHLSTIESMEAGARTFLKEAYRVLRPGGYILLCETAIGMTYTGTKADDTDHNLDRHAALNTLLCTELPDLGFEDIAIEPAFFLAGRDYIFDRTRDFSGYPKVRANNEAVGIFARKPATPDPSSK